MARSNTNSTPAAVHIPAAAEHEEQASSLNNHPDTIDNDTDLLSLHSTKKGNNKYTDDQVIELLSRVAENGSHLKEECLNAGLKYNSIFKRLARSPELCQLDTRARLASLDLRVRQLNDMVDNTEDPQKARIKCDNIKWEAARIYRKVYGDQVTVEHKQRPYGDKTMTELKEIAQKLLNKDKASVVSEQ